MKHLLLFLFIATSLFSITLNHDEVTRKADYTSQANLIYSCSEATTRYDNYRAQDRTTIESTDICISQFLYINDLSPFTFLSAKLHVYTDNDSCRVSGNYFIVEYDYHYDVTCNAKCKNDSSTCPTGQKIDETSCVCVDICPEGQVEDTNGICVCDDGFNDINGTCLPNGDDDNENDPNSDAEQDENNPCNEQINSHVKPKQRTFHEDIPIAGTNLKLWYDSSRASGYSHEVKVPYIGGTVSANLSSVKVTMTVADRILEQTFTAPSANAEATFIWDGKNSSAVEQEGIINAKISIAYNYALLNGGTYTTYKRSSVKLHRRSPKSELADAWMLSAQTHLSGRNFLQTASADGEMMRYDQPLFTTIMSPNYVKAATLYNNEIYFIYYNQVFKLDITGTVTHIAGNGAQGTGGDGLLATYAYLDNPLFIEIDSTGKIYLISADHIRMIDTTGIISTVSSGGFTSVTTSSIHDQTLYLADNAHIYAFENNALSILEDMTDIKGMTSDQEANLYITTSHKVLKRDTYGNINTIAGSDIAGYEGDYYPASLAKLNIPTAIGIDPEQNLYIFDSGNARLRKIDSNGIITTIAGNGTAIMGESINTATLSVHGILPLGNDEIYFADLNGISRIAHNELAQAYQGSDLVKINENLAYMYDAQGYILSTIDPKGVTLQTFTYDANKNLTSITDRFGQIITIERDANVLATAIIAPHGERTNLTRDLRGYLTNISYDDGSAYNFEYLDNGLMTTMIDPNANRFSHAYDANGRVLNVSDQEGGTWSFGRTSVNGVVDSSVLKALGSLKTYKDTETAKTKDMLSTSADGTQTKVSTHKDGTSRSISSCGTTKILSYVIDSYTNQERTASTTTTLPSGLSQSTSIDKTYNTTDGVMLSSVTNSVTTNAKTTTTVDAGTQTTITSPEGRVVTLSKDPNTLLVSQVQTTGLNPISYEYNLEGQVTKTTNGTRITSTTYDAKGNVATQTDANNQTTTYSYDTLSRLTQIKYPNTYSTYFTYDAAGNMKKLTTPTPAEFDSSYNKINYKISDISPLGNETKYNYDAERRLTSIVRPSLDSISYTYANGLMTQMSRPEGMTSYNYICGGRLQQVVALNGESINYTYDGNLLETMGYGGELSQVIRYSYNSDFLASSITYAGSTETLAYDNDGLLIQSGNFNITRNTLNSLPARVSDNTFIQDRTFNAYGEIDKETNTVNANNAFTYEITDRYPNGQIKTKVETLNGTAVTYNYTYDIMNRLTEVKENNTTTESYEYDQNGNRLKGTSIRNNTMAVTTSYTIEDQIERVGAFTYTYDIDGYLTSKTDGINTTSYVYGSLGELKEVTLPDGKVIEYLHNANNQRVAKKVNGTITEKYLWKDLTTLLAVYDGANNLKQRYAYSDNRVPNKVDYEGVTYYLTYDQVGSLRAVTDTAGNIIKEVSYDSFGNILSDSNPSMSLPFSFGGGLYDADTKLIRFGYRDYDSITGKWTAKDPIGFDGGDTSLLNYVNNNPVNFIDINGFAKTPLGLLAAIAHKIRKHHVLRNAYPKKGKFANTKFKDIRDLIEQTIQEGTRIHDKDGGICYVKEFEDVVGTRGEKYIKVPIHKDSGLPKTAFPVKKDPRPSKIDVALDIISEIL